MWKFITDRDTLVSYLTDIPTPVVLFIRQRLTSTATDIQVVIAFAAWRRGTTVIGLCIGTNGNPDLPLVGNIPITNYIESIMGWVKVA